MTTKEAQTLAKKINHCLCCLKLQCECNAFRQTGKCKCAGDTSISHEEWLKLNKLDKK